MTRDYGLPSVVIKLDPSRLEEQLKSFIGRHIETLCDLPGGLWEESTTRDFGGDCGVLQEVTTEETEKLFPGKGTSLLSGTTVLVAADYGIAWVVLPINPRVIYHFETTVVNLHYHPYDAKIDRSTPFGNPYKVSEYGREECIRKYRTYFYKRLNSDPAWRDQVLSLSGKRLGCHCKQPDNYDVGCHGDVIAEYLNLLSKMEQLRKTAQLGLDSQTS